MQQHGHVVPFRDRALHSPSCDAIEISHALGLSLLDTTAAVLPRNARDLHDTIFQGTQAVTMRFRALIDHFPQDDKVRRSLEKSLDMADNVPAEGRERVEMLRAYPAREELSPALKAAAARLTGDTSIEVTTATFGEPAC